MHPLWIGNLEIYITLRFILDTVAFMFNIELIAKCKKISSRDGYITDWFESPAMLEILYTSMDWKFISHLNLILHIVVCLTSN